MAGQKVILLVFSLSLLCGVCLGDRPNCANMGIKKNDYEDDDRAPPQVAQNTSTVPSNGGLVASICPQLRNQEQCCTESMFGDGERMLKGQTIFNGIEQQSQSQVAPFINLAKAIVQYYGDGAFFDDLYYSSPIKPPQADRGNITLNISPKSDNFNATDFVMRFFNRGIEQSISIINNATTAGCIRQQASSLINQDAVAAVATDLALLRNASSTFNFMVKFVQNLTSNILITSPPSDECVKNLLKLTCSKCQKTIPKLCSNVCSAVAKGCFAPYYAALNPQFNIMWNVTAQLVDFINATLTDLFNQQTRVLNFPQFLSTVNTNCRVNLTSAFPQINRKVTGIGSYYRGLAYGLLKKGLIRYEQGVSFCGSNSIRSNCWDGKNQTRSDIDDFKNESISGQAKNPVAPFNETVLTMQAMDISTPVNTFFTSPNISVLLPAAITIPQGQTYQESPSTTTQPGPSGSGATALYLSMFSFLAVLASLLA